MPPERGDRNGHTCTYRSRRVQPRRGGADQSAGSISLALMFGQPGTGSAPTRDSYPALSDAQAGEFVIERFARDTDGEAGHGAIFYRGRMTSHYAAPSKPLDLRRRTVEAPVAVDAAP